MFALPSYLCPATAVLLGAAVLIFAGMIWRHYHTDRPFPPGCCTRCGRRFVPADNHQCPRCGHSRRCRACGYNLTANRSGVCPECGVVVE